MNKNIKIIISGVVAVLILAGAGYFIYRDFSQARPGGDASRDQGYTIKELSTGELSSTSSTDIPVPDLNRMIISNKDLPPEAVVIVEKNIKSLSDELKKNPDQLDQWLDLGIQRKMAGDYDGARDAWAYATLIRPSGSVAFQNLGDLYAYYLHDNAKAEQNFLKAIENSPADVYLYFKAAEFYRDVLKNITKARTIAERGITANPNSQELKDLSASF